jgi:hypothetical protein
MVTREKRKKPWGATHLDTDSEEESDTEWLAWMTDLPRQFLVQQSQSAVQPSQSPDSFFSYPFLSSPLVKGGHDRVKPRTQELIPCLLHPLRSLTHQNNLRRSHPLHLSNPYVINTFHQFRIYLQYLGLHLRISSWHSGFKSGSLLVQFSRRPSNYCWVKR